MIKIGEKVKYIGADLVTYETRKYYLVTGYDEELDVYSVMSEQDEAYMLGKDVLDASDIIRDH